MTIFTAKWKTRRNGIYRVIVGGESGPGARPLEGGWVTDIRDQCLRVRGPFFFKQWGGTNKKLQRRKFYNRTTWYYNTPAGSL